MMNKRQRFEEAYKETLNRLEQIQSRLERKPRGKRMAGLVCILTGAGSINGIARASAIQFAHEGASHLYLVDINGENFTELTNLLNKRYPDVRVSTHVCDATDEKVVQNLIKQVIDQRGRLDVFFAHIGRTGGTTLACTDLNVFTEMSRVNVNSCLIALKYASEAMKVTSKNKPQSRGSIILTASPAGIRSGFAMVEYGATKAAVINLAQTAAWQLANSNIRVNSINPGLTQTQIVKEVFEDAQKRGVQGKLGQLSAMGRYAVSEEIANGVTFLASDESSYVNGHALVIDGGTSASLPFILGAKI